MNIEDIVKSIVREILPLLNKKILIFISGGKVNSEILLKALCDFSTVEYSIVMSQEAKLIIDRELLEELNGNIIESTEKIDDCIKNSEFVLIPILTRNTLSKVALGIEDNIVTTGIARSIMLNKEIIAVRDSYDPKNSINISEGFSSNSAYNSMLLEYEKKLESFGVKFIDSKEFKRTIQHKFFNSVPRSSIKEKEDIPAKDTTNKARVEFNSSILTVKDINQILNDGVITLRKNTIITPLAKDYIYNNKIKVEFC
ncbi:MULTISPECIES: flavoprotein [Clostridium]|uniref:Flavoprotein n=2 Tax=Clostridium TaxID=1485 RepID=A0A151APK6_9CLOT|nr:MULTISPECIES: flavoprotein [Clostridium]KYH29500.1 flavoprotein [Clostridium colicanis DSM 13634]PRR70741.1 Flavoprotein [Clostridium thermopalmarium DSM 5974]PVZ22577.1 ethanolamine utilization protein [Clostridium thermopalmarium DSM 5974]